MVKIYEGKTKDVFWLADGNIQLQFKDDVTGTDGQFDPGANTVGLTIDGVGAQNLQMSCYFFKILEERGIATHFAAADIQQGCMTVKPAKIFGKGLEVICRFKAYGSFLRRYGAYIQEGAPLDALVEMTIKDDERNDPLITKDALIQLEILTAKEYTALKDQTKQISRILRDVLGQKGIELYDIKLEFGQDDHGNIMLIDEISSGNMRTFQDGQFLSPEQLYYALFTE